MPPRPPPLPPSAPAGGSRFFSNSVATSRLTIGAASMLAAPLACVQKGSNSWQPEHATYSGSNEYNDPLSSPAPKCAPSSQQRQPMGWASGISNQLMMVCESRLVFINLYTRECCFARSATIFLSHVLIISSHHLMAGAVDCNKTIQKGVVGVVSVCASALIYRSENC